VGVVKDAVTDWVCDIVTWQVPEPFVQAPLHPANVLLVGVAVSVTSVPLL
jgi:hypothetical protein